MTASTTPQATDSPAITSHKMNTPNESSLTTPNSDIIRSEGDDNTSVTGGNPTANADDDDQSDSDSVADYVARMTEAGKHLEFLFDFMFVHHENSSSSLEQHLQRQYGSTANTMFYEMMYSSTPATDDDERRKLLDWYDHAEWSASLSLEHDLGSLLTQFCATVEQMAVEPLEELEQSCLTVMDGRVEMEDALACLRGWESVRARVRGYFREN